MSYDRLNYKQKQAVFAPEGPVIVISGAGTGKTTVLTTRIKYLINDLNVDPSRILAITFTNKAAQEMRSRLNENLNSPSPQWIKTYHSLAVSILREDFTALGRREDFNIVTEDDKAKILNQIVDKDLKKEFKTKKIIDIISFVKYKKELISPDGFYNRFWKCVGVYTSFRFNQFVNVFNQYENYLKKQNKVDFDDLLLYTEEILSNYPKIRERWQNKFDYILVDEFQDTNNNQLNILFGLINQNKNNIFVVGDQDQTIYTWRGAYPEIFKDFLNNFQDAKKYILDENYRSTKNILDCANNLIAKNKDRFGEKNLISFFGEGPKPKLYIAPTKEKEAYFVVNEIKRLVEKENEKYENFTILYRSSFSSFVFEQELARAKIPYKIYGSVKFYDRKEIKTLICYLQMVCFDDDLAFLTIINYPSRKIGDVTVEKIKQYANEKDVTLYQAAKEIDLGKKNESIQSFISLIEFLREIKEEKNILQMINLIIEKIDFIKELNKEEIYISDRIENVEELKNIVGARLIENESLTISEFLQDISILTDEDTKTDKGDFVKMMTVHASKGKEFENVFVVNLIENIFPSQKAVISSGYNEERRVAYVAITRAKKKLYLTSSKINNNMPASPSIFIKEVGYDNVEEVFDEYKTISNQDLGWFNSKNKVDNYDDYYQKETTQFKIGDVVTHTVFGEGIITAIESMNLIINFKNHGVKAILKTHKSIKRILS